MKIETLPPVLPAYGAGDMDLRNALVKALDYLGLRGTAADKSAFANGLQAAALIANDNAQPAAVAMSAVERIFVSATQVDLVLASTQSVNESRALTASQFAVTGGTVSAAARLAPRVIRLTGTAFAAAVTTAFTASGTAALVARLANWVAFATNAALGVTAAPTINYPGVTYTRNSATQATLVLPARNTGRPAFGQFVPSAGTITAVSYVGDNTIVFTGTGLTIGGTVTYTDPGSGQRLNRIEDWATYTLATGASPVAV